MLLSRPPKDHRLVPFVEALWTCEVSDGRGLERILPNGRTQLFINLHEDVFHTYDACGLVCQQTSGVVVQGPKIDPVVIHRAEQRLLCGALFSSSGAFSYFGNALAEFGSGLVDLEHFSWLDAKALQERLYEMRDPSARMDLLESALLARAPTSLFWDRIVRQACVLLRSGMNVSVVASHFDTTQQTLITRFRERTGLTPKTFSRIERFQSLIRKRSPDVSWAEAALDVGFSDQSHMVREFKRFAGISPTQYKPNADGQRNHVDMPD